jgi:hypothetical protein
MSEPLPNVPDPDSETENPEHSSPDAPGPGMPPPTAVESLVNALLDAGPDVAEHVVRAAQELLLAAQVIVDAADTAVREQRDLHAGADAADKDADAGSTGTGDDGAARRRHLDLAE